MGQVHYVYCSIDIIDIDIYLTAIGLAPGGGITRHIYNQTIPNLPWEKKFW